VVRRDQHDDGGGCLSMRREGVVSADKAVNSVSGRGQYLCREFFEVSFSFSEDSAAETPACFLFAIWQNRKNHLKPELPTI